MSNTDTALELYRLMCEIRAFEEEGERLLRAGRLAGNLHLSLGQEAVAAGVCSALAATDHITTTHRGHGHCVAKGGDPERMFAELFGHADGYSKGRAGSMHIADPDSGILGATAIVGGSFGMAIGAAFGAQVLGTGAVAVAFFGEGASAEGTLHEALNLAALWKLPMVFCCENNQYAEMTHVREHISGSIRAIAAAHDLAAEEIDGNDAVAVREAADAAVARARAGEGPTLLECMTYRWSGHYVGDPESYRDPEEVAAGKAADPIALLGERLAAGGEGERLEEIREAANRRIAEAADRAAGGQPASPDLLLADVYAS
ncbi:MAG: thiamine pyrophosphate-dependent dehydrogenase E1 component subunit alpha [Actinobacteria bacterium]|nr:thiamine pyrophosphate-dependent dehydrogenase E1 component subunit alpha [Actinomycetota bacterium]